MPSSHWQYLQLSTERCYTHNYTHTEGIAWGYILIAPAVLCTGSAVTRTSCSPRCPSLLPPLHHLPPPVSFISLLSFIPECYYDYHCASLSSFAQVQHKQQQRCWRKKRQTSLNACKHSLARALCLKVKPTERQNRCLHVDEKTRQTPTHVDTEVQLNHRHTQRQIDMQAHTVDTHTHTQSC